MIVLDNVPEIKGYIERALNIRITDPHRVLGFMTDDRRPLCAVAFSEFNGSNIELTIVAQPGGLTRGVARYIATYVFNKLDCRRVTVRTKRRNKLGQKMATRFGFTFETCKQEYFVDDDAIVFRMLRKHCRWF